MSGKVPSHGNGWHSRGYLPHFDRPGLLQGLTFRLADLVAAHRIPAWRRELHSIEKEEETGEVDDLAARHRELHRRIAEFEDTGAGKCYLKQPEIARFAVEALTCFDGEHYELKGFCVMPNHVHVLILTFGTWSTGRILKSWKTWTSQAANRILNRTGAAFRAPDYYDRFIRDEVPYLKALNCIHQNPVKARLVATPEDWPWSSARRSEGKDRNSLLDRSEDLQSAPAALSNPKKP